MVNEEKEGRGRSFLCSQHKHLQSQLSLPAQGVWANSSMKLIRLCPSTCYAKWEAILPSLAHVPGPLADRAGGRHCGMPGDAPSWVTNHSISSRAALLPGVWHHDTQLAWHSNCSCASTCLNNDIFKLTPAEMFAFCSHAPRECFLLIALTAWDFPKILNSFTALLPRGLLLKILDFLSSRNTDASFPALVPDILFLLSFGNQMKPICRNLLQTLFSAE